jgi:hypothetical protein
MLSVRSKVTNYPHNLPCPFGVRGSQEGPELNLKVTSMTSCHVIGCQRQPNKMVELRESDDQFGVANGRVNGSVLSLASARTFPPNVTDIGAVTVCRRHGRGDGIRIVGGRRLHFPRPRKGTQTRFRDRLVPAPAIDLARFDLAQEVCGRDHCGHSAAKTPALLSADWATIEQHAGRPLLRAGARRSAVRRRGAVTLGSWLMVLFISSIARAPRPRRRERRVGAFVFSVPNGGARSRSDPRGSRQRGRPGA